ncbi:unnamed protein product [Calicophoron daubneyi]|uniref:UspA domain-containing protein n=1 Tax=Calicophoron daubneyi TaxID=300641 RepID=A0AAV2TKU8_CALDB
MSLGSVGTSHQAPRRILFPIDRSERAKAVVNWYLSKLYRPDDQIYLVLIVELEQPKHSYDFSPTWVPEDLEQKVNIAVKNGKAVGKQFQDIFKSHGLDSEFAIQVGSKPGDLVLQIAKEKDIDIIVVGSWGLGTIKGTFHGGGTEYILHHSHIPILLIPPPL